MNEVRGELRRDAGDSLPEMLYDAEQRACIRHYMATEGAGVRRVAGEMGLSEYRLRTFLQGVQIDDLSEAKKLDAWCEGRPVPWVPVEEVAMQILTRWGPAYRRKQDREVFAAAVLSIYEQLRIRLPRWAIDAIRG